MKKRQFPIATLCENKDALFLPLGSLWVNVLPREFVGECLA